MVSKVSARSNKTITIKTIMSLIAIAVGLLSFLFFLAPGISYTNASTTGYYAGFNLGQMTFGSKYAGINPGLLSAFIIMSIGIILAGVMNFSDIAGAASIVFFITSAVLWFCTVFLYGNISAVLGAGGWCLGIFNVFDAILVFVGVSYR